MPEILPLTLFREGLGFVRIHLFEQASRTYYSPRTGRHNFFHLGCQKIFHCRVRTSKKSYFIISSKWNVVLDSDRQKERKNGQIKI